MKTLPLLLALCFAATAAQAVKNPDTFTHVTIADADSLDPAWSYDTASHNIIANIYEFLLAYKGSSLTALEGRLASKYAVSKDKLTYTFAIRTGIKFHDGSPLTPEDVKYSLLRFMLIDRDGGPSSLLLEPVLGVLSTRDAKGALLPGLFEKADKAVTVKDGAVIVRLAKPYAPFLSILANFGAIVSKPFCVAHGGWDGTAAGLPAHNNPKKESLELMDRTNGTGPFKLERWDKKSKETFLVRHDAYWRGPAKLARVVIRVIDEFATRKLMLQAGDADTIYAPQMMFSQVEKLPEVEVLDGLQNLERSIILFFTFDANAAGNPNLGSGKLDGAGIPADFFSDRDVRKAFAYSIDYDGYVKDILRGKGRQAHGFIPEGLVGYDPKPPVYRLDAAKAAEHLKKAWGGKVWEKGFQFSIVFNAGSAPAQIVCQMIKKNIEALNPKFRIDVRSVQWSTFLEQGQARKLPIFIGAWQADYPDPHNFAYPLLHSSGYFPAKQGYKNAEVDKLVETAVSTLEPEKRAKLYGRLLAIYNDDVPHVEIADSVRYRTQRSWVKGYVFNPVFPDAPYGSDFYQLRKE